ncbi:MFS transporter [Schauerella aestuarii]|uniref:MFS transporter n=1 Tax=Schauerella aestuarii TaxID=2511204 RepID=UPI00136F99E4|nr:MFS transporter [Achromobacter aestuarii]MYZ43831.1 MFS transporter [Achromobacter aestuarii]
MIPHPLTVDEQRSRTGATAFRRLVQSNFAAQFSEQIALAAAPLAAVLAFGATAAQTGALQTAQTLPFLLFALPAGVLADRYARRTLMVTAEALRAGALLAIVALLAAQALGLNGLALLGFVGAAGTVLYSVAAPALVPQLVPRAQLTAANRSIELARSTAFVAGPAAGGSLVGMMGAPAAYVLATALSIVALLLLLRLPHATTRGFLSPASTDSPASADAAASSLPNAHTQCQPPRKHVWHDLRDGAAFVWTQPLLRPLLIGSTFFNTAWFILQAVYVAYAIDRLGLNATGVGLTLGSYGAGMVAGALLAPALSKRVSFGTMIMVGPASALLASLLMLTTSTMAAATLAAVAMFLFGAGPILWTIATTTLRQTVTPNAMLGRVSSVILAATYGSRPIGAAIGALLAARFGVDACLWASSVFFVVQFAVIGRSPARGLKTLPAND